LADIQQRAGHVPGIGSTSRSFAVSQTINTNISSLTAQRNGNRVQNDLATAINRLSSGLRINSAKDDAAGLAISERFTTQIRGLNVAARNANDAISLTQTAEGALASVGSNLQRIRELAVQSANATNSTSDRAALQAEAAQLVAEIQRVGAQTDFNGVKLLDGSFNAQAFQVGANAGQTISVNAIVDARTTALGANTLVADGSITGGTVMSATAISTGSGLGAETDLALTTSAGTVTGISYAANSGANQIATAINNAASGIGITATASNSAALTGLSAGTISFNLVGGTGAATTAAISAAITDPADLTNLSTAINAASNTTGITASFTNGNKNSLMLTAADGRNISIGTFANDTTGNQNASFGGAAMVEGAAATANAVATGTVSLSSSRGAILTATANGDVFAAAGANTSTFTTLATVNISTAAGASAALNVLDAALAQVNSGRAELGAIQNRFDATIENLQTFSENLSASRSRIQDADFAAETASLSRAQVLQQAATAMIAQANQQPQQVLALLR
jgi:flagellin